MILAAFAVWLEPTRVVWGWLRGEAFYHGRPMSYWAREIGRWYVNAKGGWSRREERYTVWNLSYKRGLFERLIDRFREPPNRVFPIVLNGDPQAETVLRELAVSCDSGVCEIAQER